MTQGEKASMLKNIVLGIDAIKKQYEVKVIKDYKIPPLVSFKTKEEIGFAVKLFLNTRYDYDDKSITTWKNLLKADDWYISVKRNQLSVTFKVRYKEKA